MDLRDIMYWMQNYKTKNSKIGIVTQNFPGQFPTHKKGEIVIYRDEILDERYYSPKERSDKTVTIEIPLSKEEIEKRESEGSGITTICTMAGVPKSYIEEVVIE